MFGRPICLKIFTSPALEISEFFVEELFRDGIRKLVAVGSRLSGRKMRRRVVCMGKNEHSDFWRFGGLGGLARANINDLQRVHGIGPVKAIEIKAALELGKRLAYANADQKPLIKTPAEAAQMLMLTMGMLEQEEVRTLLLDSRNRLLGMPMIYRGTLNAANMRVAEVFKEAIRHNAASVIVAHNHPSGDPTPSTDDVFVTKELTRAGKLLDIEVLDHLVIAQNRYVSLKERGLGFD